MVSVKDKRVSSIRTICEVHREIYDILNKHIKDKQVLKRLIVLLEEAYGMGKKMNNRLRMYKYNYDESWWEENKNYGESLKRRKGKK